MNIREQVLAQKELSLSPSSKCQHPITFYNAYVRDVVSVDCGKCDYCLHKKSVELTNRVAQECKQHKYSIFFTLTYDNEHLPQFVYHSGSLFVGNRPVDFDGNNYIYPTLDLSKVDPEFDVYDIQPSKVDLPSFGYACKRDLQLWLKRLRVSLSRGRDCVNGIFGINRNIKNLSKYEKKLRYFLVSEYGPTTFRPHYHGILWTDSQDVARWLERNISACWSLCDSSRVDVQYVASSAPQYVAKYCNSITHLPKVLQIEHTKPFYLASKNPVIGSWKVDAEEISDYLLNGVVERIEQRNDEKSGTSEFALVPLSHSLLSRYFPAPKGFSFQNDYDYISLYDKYVTLRRYLPKKVWSDKFQKLVFSPILSQRHEHSSLGYINSDDYCYQDKRCALMCDFWCSQDIIYPERDGNGRFTGRHLTTRLTPKRYFELLVRLYKRYEYSSLRSWYETMEFDSKFMRRFNYDTLYHWFALSWYRPMIFQLPLRCNKSEFLDLKQNPLFAPLKQLDIVYEEIYQSVGGFLRRDFSNYVHRRLDSISLRFDADLEDKRLRSIKSKKTNELLYNSLNN